MHKFMIAVACAALTIVVAGCEKKAPIANEHDTTPSNQVVDSSGMVYTDLQGHPIGSIEAEVDAAETMDTCVFSNSTLFFSDAFYTMSMTCPDNTDAQFAVNAAKKYARTHLGTLVRIDPADGIPKNYKLLIYNN